MLFEEDGVFELLDGECKHLRVLVCGGGGAGECAVVSCCFATISICARVPCCRSELHPDLCCLRSSPIHLALCVFLTPAQARGTAVQAARAWSRWASARCAARSALQSASVAAQLIARAQVTTQPSENWLNFVGLLLPSPSDLCFVLQQFSSDLRRASACITRALDCIAQIRAALTRTRTGKPQTPRTAAQCRDLAIC